jgi:hypothetical protein
MAGEPRPHDSTNLGLADISFDGLRTVITTRARDRATPDA